MDLNRFWPDLLAEETQVRDRLLEAYDDQRGYHDQQHLAEVLTHLEELLPDDYVDAEAVVLAAWFHDAVYDGEYNEERSAIMAERELATVKAPGLIIDEVARLVRLTRTHAPADDDLNGQYLCDADLAILAAEPDRYAAYVAGVREEYRDVPEADFKAGRAAILQALLAKPTLFHSEAAIARWEARARANVGAEIRELVSDA